METLGEPSSEDHEHHRVHELDEEEEGRLTACSASTSGSVVTAERQRTSAAAQHQTTTTDEIGASSAPDIDEDYRLYDVVTPQDSPTHHHSAAPAPTRQLNNQTAAALPNPQPRPTQQQLQAVVVAPTILHQAAPQHDDVASLQLAHRLALQRILELEHQLRERSEQLVMQQAKVDSSKDKIQVLSHAVQTLKKKVEANTRRSALNSLSSPPAQAPLTTSTATQQTDDDWRSDYEASNASLRNLCAAQEQEAVKWKASASAAREHAAELVLEVKRLTQALDRVTANRNAVRSWSQKFVYQCLAEELEEDRTALAQKWSTMSVDDVAEWLDGGANSGGAPSARNDSVVQMVAALVGPTFVQPTPAANDASPTSHSVHDDREHALSPLANTTMVRSPSTSPPALSVRRTGEARSLLEELARASVATAASTATGGGALPPPPDGHSPHSLRRNRQQDDHLVNVRAIEMRLEVLRKALFSPQLSTATNTASRVGQLPASLRAGIEAEIAQLQKALEHMAAESATAIRIASRRQQTVALFSHTTPSISSCAINSTSSPPRPPLQRPSYEVDISSVVQYDDRLRRHPPPPSRAAAASMFEGGVIELSPAAKDPTAIAPRQLTSQVVYCMRSSSEEYTT
ncbi:Hypothetical protein, putative [Bodo saltans]|uniref:Uncharacterized protein n=1 Tax=Bodo saltans TaxID=75058 RepID=A0A0S4IV63_BODSA|nr:Hypothetical protein, putative [Bodo saltans]|eukprot:CUF97589.1 Hypothetical protein, putative [Bodo saltans]